MMPDLDGVEVLRWIRARPERPHLPVVLVTARADDEQRARGLEAGADDFLEQPLDRTTLVARVRSLLRAKAAQDQAIARAATLAKMDHERWGLRQEVLTLHEGHQLLSQAVRVRDEFLTMASHELKTPLTSLRLLTEALMRPGSEATDRSATATRLAAIQRGVQRLEAIVDRLLDGSTISLLGVELDRRETDLSVIVRESASRYRDLSERASCTIAVDAPEPLVGSWDPVRLASVVDNLLSNAIKYGGGKPIHVGTQRVANRVRLSVQDHGIGVAEEDHQRIFLQFERAVSKRHYGGFGLGLWVAKRFVDAMGGEMRLESRPGEGALFVVELPTLHEGDERGHSECNAADHSE